ncbi:hypothetical protein FHL15_005311 [Xylaria flabelliformis]|uniref:Uncharacterized protein n=1 Tax=Xylaria flabelliformis TaxID=2512241 RepID=A0A553I145_9PEZI|nr:hypothetical protein FHL15_005311 [Xylaria flabelliformis]
MTDALRTEVEIIAMVEVRSSPKSYQSPKDYVERLKIRQDKPGVLGSTIGAFWPSRVCSGLAANRCGASLRQRVRMCRYNHDK